MSLLETMCRARQEWGVGFCAEFPWTVLNFDDGTTFLENLTIRYQQNAGNRCKKFAGGYHPRNAMREMRALLQEKTILGAFGDFQSILGAALEVQKLILGMQSSILGMASHDLSNTKTTNLGATPGAIPGVGGNPHERFSFALAFSERFFKNWGGPRVSDRRCFEQVLGKEKKNELLPTTTLFEKTLNTKW